jgi:hypothetical protein
MGAHSGNFMNSAVVQPVSVLIPNADSYVVGTTVHGKLGVVTFLKLVPGFQNVDQ